MGFGRKSANNLFLSIKRNEGKLYNVHFVCELRRASACLLLVLFKAISSFQLCVALKQSKEHLFVADIHTSSRALVNAVIGFFSSLTAMLIP